MLLLLPAGIELLWTLQLSFPHPNMAPTIYRISDFLPVHTYQEVVQYAANNQALFRPSTNTPSVLHDFPTHWLEGQLMQALPTVLENLHLLSFPLQNIEMELYAVGDGNYQPKHIDNNSELGSNRFLSFAYFCSCDPQPFQGGELIVHGHDDDTIVPPVPNSIVFYASSHEHEVLPIRSDGNWQHCRFTVEGWFRMAQFEMIPAPPQELIEMGIKPGGFDQQLTYQYPNLPV